MIAVVTEVQGEQQLLAALQRFEGLYDDLRPVFEAVGSEALNDIQHRFEVGGPGWPPHALSTRRNLAGPRRLLRDTDTLYGSFAPNAAGNVFRVGSDVAEFGTDVFYASFHQEGTERIPQRKFINVTRDQEEKYNEIASRVQLERIRALGFEVS